MNLSQAQTTTTNLIGGKLQQEALEEEEKGLNENDIQQSV